MQGAQANPPPLRALHAGLDRAGIELASPVVPDGFTVPIRVELDPITEKARRFRSFWVVLADFPRAFPYRCRVILPLKRTEGDGTRRSEWESLRAECFINAFGVAVHMRFGFGSLTREKAAAWPSRQDRFVIDTGVPGNPWIGTEHDLLALVARCAMAAFGPAHAARFGSRWPAEFQKGCRRVYAEMRERDDWNPERERKLLYGLARRIPGHADLDRSAVEADSLMFRPTRRRAGEASLLTPGGATLLRIHDGTEESRREGPCQSINIVHALALHGMLSRPLGRLGSSAGGDEAFHVVNDPLVREIESERIRILARVQQSYGWMPYYSARHGLAASISNLAPDLKAAVLPAEVEKRLLAQMSGFVNSEARA
jgi:hypothetical protein